MRIAIPLFDRFTALDAVGPYEVLSRLPGAKVSFVAAEPGVFRTDTRMLALTADAAYDDLPSPDVLVLAAAGVLDGLEATTHWAARSVLAELGARPVERRVVEQGKILTAA